jgi:hypothetical protein
MGDIKTLEQLCLISAYIVPGLVALFIRAQFVTGRIDTSEDGLLVFFTVSLIWTGVTAPVLTWLGQAELAWYTLAAAWLLWAIIGPAVVGVILGLDVARGWSRWLLNKMKLRTVHPIGAAWDWKFSHAHSSWIIVTMKDGSKVHGFLGANSFVSSDPKERDLYIEQVWRVDKNNNWTRHEEWSVIIPHGEIRCVELMTDKPGDKR